MNKNIYTLLVGTISLGLFSVGNLDYAHAFQAATPDPESFDFAGSQGVEERLTPNGNDLMGDNIDPNTGTLTFEHTDVVLPGNSGLEVAIRRRRSQGLADNVIEQVAFGDWFLDIPTVSYTYIRPYALGHGSDFFGPGADVTNELTPRPSIQNDCTPFLDGLYTIPYEDGTPELHDQVELKPYEFSRGLVVNIPGRYNNQSASSNTTSQPWRGECLAQGNGVFHYIAYAPNGNIYKFERQIYRQAAPYEASLRQFINGNHNAAGLPPIQDPEVALIDVPREHLIYLITEVTDINGNWVRYDYSDDEEARLTRIHANDGREITLTYEGAAPTVTNSRLVSQVQAHGRSWTYDYTAIGFPHLTHVTLPDGRQWIFDDGNGLLDMNLDVPYNFECNNNEDGSYGAAIRIFSLTHPDGMTGHFTVRETRHLKGVADASSSPSNSFEFDEDVLQCERPTFRPRNWPIYRVMSLDTKTLSGPGFPTATWSYKYSGYQSGELLGATTWTEITNPEGHVTRYSYYREGFHDGLLDKMEVRETATGPIIHITQNSYIEGGHPGIDTGIFYDNSPHIYQSAAMRKARRLLKETTITQDGDTYRTRYSYDVETGVPGAEYWLPTRIERVATPSGTSRIEETTYQHITSGNNWIIGLPKTVTRNGKLFDEVTYDSKGRPTVIKQFGVTQATLTYHNSGAQAGQVHTVTDALNRTTTVNNFYRGTPQSVTRPDGVTLSRVVDDNGWVTSDTNARGYTTNYSYNDVGWLTLIDAHAPWSDTVFAYSNIGNGLTRTVTRGQARTTETYDGLFRQIATKVEDLTGGSSPIHTRSSYDGLSRMTFASFPSYAANPTAGTETAYDALNRVVETREVNTGVSAITTTAYLSNARIRVTDPVGAQTTTHYRRFGMPDGGDLISIAQPEGVTTDMTYDIFGNILTARQFGNSDGFNVDQTQYYTYDDRLRLCRQSVPESGDSLYQYDNANQMTAMAEGQAFTGSTTAGCASTLPASARIAYTYDALGRVTLTNYPSTTPDITYAYDANSNVTRTVRGGTVWDYGYNSGDMLTSETLSMDGRSYQGLNSYNADGHLMIRTTPGGRTIDYQVNGLGQPTAASIGGFAYASGVTYHANGALASANYGNGQVRTNTQNARQLLSGINITNGATIALGLAYAHDANGRITDMDDTHSGGLQRRYQYDLLGRLVYAWCDWGTSDYTYDALGNMRLYEVDDFRHNRHIVQDYTYDARNRMASTTYEAGITETYSFDSYGRITIGHNRTTHYDVAHRPTSVVHNNGRTDSFIYDGNLHRAKETIFHKTRYSVYGQGGTLLFRDNITDGETTDYVRLGGHTIARLKTDSAGITTVTYPHTNHLGSPVAATDATGDLLWREEYTPFGRKHENAPGQRGEEGFTGHIFDGQNTVHMKARTYMTTSYRFTTPDPVTFLSSGLDPAYFNRYAYVGNDPVNNIDPDGRFALGLASKAFKVLRKGGDLGATFAGAAADAKAVFAAPGSSSLGARGLAAVSLASEIFSPVSARDAKAAARAIKGSKPCCFTAGTLIETEDGQKPIETIKVGDKVWAHNPETGETALKEVTDFIPAHDREIWKVAVEGKTSSEVFETTHEHPWWVLGEDGNGGAWKETHELKPGMRVIARGEQRDPRLILASTNDVRAVAPDRIMTITSVENTHRIDATYNITVDDFHTYFVGEQRVLVHNCKINQQKQAGHIPGTPQNANRIKQGKPTSTFTDGQTADALTKDTVKTGTPHPTRPGVKTKEFGGHVGTGPNGGTQTSVRTHTDANGVSHGHPHGREFKDDK